ncbi:MAG: J domain-containing protein [Leptospirillum sp.]|nr:J domain-containing protein [Nitrospiraceae bacterium]
MKDYYRERAALRRRLEEMVSESRKGMEYALERMFLVQPESYILFDERYSELLRLFSCLLRELDDVNSWGALLQIQRRAGFLEERFEDVDCVLWNRPRKARSRIAWSRFFGHATGSGGEDAGGSSGSGSGLSHSEACMVLGVEATATLVEIRHRFRNLVKSLHPDVRDGDRSSEAEMRKVIEAYNVLKSILGEEARGSS